VLRVYRPTSGGNIHRNPNAVFRVCSWYTYFKTPPKHIRHDVYCKVSSLVYKLISMYKCPVVTTNKQQVITVSAVKNGKKRDSNTSVWSASLSAKLAVAYSILILIYGIYPRKDLLG
jgi:hypothetical protein